MLIHYNPIITGLGDRLIDYIGILTIAKLNNSELKLFISNKFDKWTYNLDILNIPYIEIINKTTENLNKGNKIVNNEILINYPSHRVFDPVTSHFIYQNRKNFNLDKYSFNQINQTYKKLFQQIKLNTKYNTYNDYIGIHLRTSDKISNNNFAWELNLNDYNKLKKFLINYIINENYYGEKFVIFGESNTDINKFIDEIKNMDSKVNIINGSELNKGSDAPIIDMFCLSSTKKIVQGINYSTFSICASLIGNKELINFSKICNFKNTIKLINNNFLNVVNFNFNPYQIYVVSAHWNEDINWLKESGLKHSICDRFENLNYEGTNDCDSKNIGYEVTAYLKFIVNYYDNLPRYMVFIHGHNYAWHQYPNNLNMLDRINYLQYSYLPKTYVKDIKYISLNNYLPKDNYLLIIKNLFKDPYKTEYIPYFDKYVKPYLHFEIDEELGVETDCCAQFLIKKENILKYPKKFYINLFNFFNNLKSTNIKTDKFVDILKKYAIGMEYLWQLIFNEKQTVELFENYTANSLGFIYENDPEIINAKKKYKLVNFCIYFIIFIVIIYLLIIVFR